MMMTSLDVVQYSKLFHLQMQQEICSKVDKVSLITIDEAICISN